MTALFGVRTQIFRQTAIYGNTAQLRLRVSAVFLPHFFSLKNEKYIQDSRLSKKGFALF